jgi:hypothetical protein
MKFVNEKQFVEMFQDMKGASFVSLITATTPKLLSKGKRTGQPRPTRARGFVADVAHPRRSRVGQDADGR